MSVLALTTSLFDAYDSASAQAREQARAAARAKSIAALSAVKAPAAKLSPSGEPIDAKRDGAASHAAPSNLELLRKSMDAHTIDVEA